MRQYISIHASAPALALIAASRCHFHYQLFFFHTKFISEEQKKRHTLCLLCAHAVRARSIEISTNIRRQSNSIAHTATAPQRHQPCSISIRFSIHIRCCAQQQTEPLKIPKCVMGIVSPIDFMFTAELAKLNLQQKQAKRTPEYRFDWYRYIKSIRYAFAIETPKMDCFCVCEILVNNWLNYYIITKRKEIQISSI